MMKCTLLLIWIVALAGCASRPPPPPMTIPENTWRQIDLEILAASHNATEQASHFASDALQEWIELVRQRTETDFIPWFSRYRTRKWLSIKVSWYQMSADEDKEQVIDRLALYLQQQYRKRVLVPVARQTDPVRIRERTTRFYIWLLGELLAKIQLRHGVPPEQFERRLAGIPAITLAPPANQDASLQQLLRTERLDRLAAYRALNARVREAPATVVLWSEDAGITSVARQASRQLTAELAAGSVAGAVSAMIGQAAGTVLSLGVMGVTELLREHERPEREARLRKSLNAAFEQEWREWMRSRDHGVMAGVHYLDDSLEQQLLPRAESPARPAYSAQLRPGLLAAERATARTTGCLAHKLVWVARPESASRDNQGGSSASVTSFQLLSGSKRVMARACLPPSGPRSFSNTSPSWLIMKLITPLSA